MNYDQAVEKLGCFTPLLHGVPVKMKEQVTDIRLRADKPVVLSTRSKNYFLLSDGSVSPEPGRNCVTVAQEDIEAIFHRLCSYSVYSHTDELCNGYISVDRCLRVGISGTAVVEDGKLKTVRRITGLSVRIPREILNCAEEILRAGAEPERGILIAGAPSSGKTTMLRDLARILGNKGRRTVVLDERFELLSDGFDLGTCTDVLQGYPKKDGFSHAIRCLSPEIILCDELSDEDFPALEAAAFAGVAIAATVHAGSIAELYQRPLCRKLLGSGIFNSVVFLSGQANPRNKPVMIRVGDILADGHECSADSVQPYSRIG